MGLYPVTEGSIRVNGTNIMEYAKDATIIFISHRLSTTRDADRIYMFEKQACYYRDEVPQNAS